MKKLFVALCAVALISAYDTSSVSACDDADYQQCKIDGEDVGRTDITISLAHSAVRITDWIAKTDSVSEYSGFHLVVTGDPVVFTVKAGQNIFTSSGDSWSNPFGESGSMVSGISYVDFCDNGYTESDDEDDCTTTTVTTTSSTTSTSTTSTTLPECAVIPILNDPAFVDWYKNKYLVHGRLLPLTPVDYPLEMLVVTLETEEDGIWLTASCPLTQTRRTRWVCTLPNIKGMVKITRDVPTGKDSYAFRIREKGTSFVIPSSKRITTTVYLLCSPGINTAEWTGNLGDKIVNKIPRL